MILDFFKKTFSKLFNRTNPITNNYAKDFSETELLAKPVKKKSYKPKRRPKIYPPKKS